MNIVCAETVLAGTPAFQTLGTCTVLPDRAITSDHLQNTDALIVRSKTSINAGIRVDTALRLRRRSAWVRPCCLSQSFSS